MVTRLINKCEYECSDAALETLDTLHELEQSVSDETKMSLMINAGHVTRSDEYSDEELFNLEMSYYEKYEALTQSLDRGGLKVPADNACQWTLFCFIMFVVVKDEVCRESLLNLFLLVAETYSFQMVKKTCTQVV